MASKKVSPAGLRALAILLASGGSMHDAALESEGVTIATLNALSFARMTLDAMFAAEEKVSGPEEKAAARKAAREEVRAKAYVTHQDRTYRITDAGKAALAAADGQALYGRVSS